MSFFEIGPNDSLYFEYEPPSGNHPLTYVFINAITGDTGMWQAEIGPTLREAGYGSLAFNFRGQAKSTASEGLAFDEALITGDLIRLLQHLNPPNPVLVGLSIGGLYGSRAYLGGIPAAGLVLVNTLRKIGPRISWMNDTTVRVMEVGGPALMRDIISPLIFGPPWLEKNRENFLKQDTVYEPMDKNSGIYNLLSHMGQADWNLPYEKLDCPVLVVTGPHDRIFYDKEVIKELCARIPKVQMVELPDAAHMLPAECGPEFSDVLLNFAKSLKP